MADPEDKLYELETISNIHNNLRRRRNSPEIYKAALSDLEVYIAQLINKVTQNGKS